MREPDGKSSRNPFVGKSKHDKERFFGGDARPIAQGVTRRHPMAAGLYAVVMLLGAIFVFHLYAANRTESQLFPGIDHWVTFLWKWMLVLGGAGALFTISLSPRVSPHWPDLSDLLHLEAIFAVVAAFGLLVYVGVVIHLQGIAQSYQAIAIYAVMIVSHVWRAVDAVKDAKRLEELAEQYVKPGDSDARTY